MQNEIRTEINVSVRPRDSISSGLDESARQKIYKFELEHSIPYRGPRLYQLCTVVQCTYRIVCMTVDNNIHLLYVARMGAFENFAAEKVVFNYELARFFSATFFNACKSKK